MVGCVSAVVLCCILYSSVYVNGWLVVCQLLYCVVFCTAVCMRTDGWLCVSCCTVLYFVQQCVCERMVGCVSAVVLCCILYSSVYVNGWLVVCQLLYCAVFCTAVCM